MQDAGVREDAGLRSVPRSVESGVAGVHRPCRNRGACEDARRRWGSGMAVRCSWRLG
jgi:hypothetical protein